MLNFKQIQTSSNVITNVKCLCSDGIPECLFFLSISSPIWFLKFIALLKGTARLRQLQYEWSAALINIPLASFILFFLLHFSLFLFLFSFTTPTCSHPPLIIAGWLSFFQQSFSGSLINCLLSVCGVGHSVLHTFTLSAGLFSAASLESLLQKLW